MLKLLSPVNANVRVAVVLPFVAPVTLLIVRFRIFVFSV